LAYDAHEALNMPHHSRQTSTTVDDDVFGFWAMDFITKFLNL
jgi:hypothetical protein